MAKPIDLENGNVIPFTESQLEDMKRMYLSGVSAKKVGERFGIAQQSVTSRLVTMGVELRPKGGLLKADESVARKAACMRAKGWPWRLIEGDLGLSTRTLYDAMKRYQVIPGEA